MGEKKRQHGNSEGKGDWGSAKRSKGGKKGGGRYNQQYHHQGGQSYQLGVGTRGLLVSCPTGKERQCVKEVMNILDEYCTSSEGNDSSTASAAAAGESSATSISKRLELELEELRTKKKSKFRHHPQIGVNGMVFIEFLSKTPKEDADGEKEGSEKGEEDAGAPLKAVLSMLNDAAKTKTCKARWAMRFLPVETTCTCNLEDIGKVADRIVGKYFPAQEKSEEGDDKDDDNKKAQTLEKQTFAVEYEHRASKSFDRLDVINAFAKKIKQPPYAVSLKQPDQTILVQMIKSQCFVSVVRDYQKFQKFNLQRVASND